jgi:hypothetical protein
MSIQLKINKKIDLKAPKFLCDDNPLGTHLNECDMLSHLNKYGFTGIIGRPGSGKTSLLISFLTATGKNRIFKKVHVLATHVTLLHVVAACGRSKELRGYIPLNWFIVIKSALHSIRVFK